MKTYRLLIILIFFGIATLLLACIKDIGPAPGSDVDNRYMVVGYLGAWTGDVNAVQFDKLTHINYAFALPTLTGALQPVDNDAKLQSLVIAAHLKKVKVLISIGGWNNGDASGFISLSANPQYLTTFINSVIDCVIKYGLDGADIDWETPILGKTDANYANLLNQLSQALHARGKLLSAAFPPFTGNTNGEAIQSVVFGYLDYCNIMAYDSFLDKNHSTYALADTSIKYWKKRGLATNKIILGVPFYGRTSINFNFTSYNLYTDILKGGGSANADLFNNIGYNGISTIKSKAALAQAQAGGIMIWELGGDTNDSNSLLTAIDQVVNKK